MTVSIEKKILLGFGAALLVMLFAGTAAWWNLQRFEATFLRVDHTHHVLSRLEQTLTGVLTMQTSTRGFILTGRDELLDVYRQGDARVDDSLSALRQLTADHALQQQRLDRLEPLVAQARSIMAGRIVVRRDRGLDAAAEVSLLLAGQQAVESVRQLIDEMSAEERRLLHARLASSQAAGRSTLAAILAACALATALIVLAGILLRHDFQRRRQAEESLRVLNDQLEQRVRDRTAQLEAANLAMTREIANRQRAQDSLLASEQRLRTTLDGMLEGCQILSPDLRYLYLNDTSTLHARRHKQELLGRTVTECYPGIEHTALYATLQHCLAHRTARRFEELFTFPDGAQAWFLLGIQPAPEGLTVLSLDITERKLSEARILQDNATLEQRVRERTAQFELVNRELEAFSYSVSHDLRAPLRHIDGFSHLLSKRAHASLDDQARHYLDTISTSARHMGRLIDDLLAFSRIGRTALKLTPLDHDALLAETIAAGRYEQSGHPILWEIAPLPTVSADAALLRQVWANLLDNAVKYSGKSPRPRIAIAHRPDLAQPGELVFSISDNGVGFDPRYAGKLFGVFQRLHGPAEFEGTGIGLANVRRIITHHGGRTWAEGRLGEGATFYFSLPASDAPPTAHHP